jgi:hypothetical protein
MYAPVLARYVLVAGFPAFLKVLRDRKGGPVALVLGGQLLHVVAGDQLRGRDRALDVADRTYF